MTKTITKKETESLLRRAVRDRGKDATGNLPGGSGCVYRDKGKPVCIVGQVVSYLTDKPLHRVFPGKENLKTWDDVQADVERRLDVQFTEGASELLYKAQGLQDALVGGWGSSQHRTWGEVLKKVL